LAASEYRPRAAESISFRWIAMSIATRASTAVRRKQSPARVRGSAVTRNPRIDTTSFGGIAYRPTMSPRRERMPDRGGATISTGLVASTSRPNNQAAVSPAKTTSSGSKRRHAASVKNVSSLWAALRYSSAPMRTQALPLRALSVSPAARASSREKVPLGSASGMRGDLGTLGGCRLAAFVPMLHVKRTIPYA
jgi:hypothetical protein